MNRYRCGACGGRCGGQCMYVIVLPIIALIAWLHRFYWKRIARREQSAKLAADAGRYNVEQGPHR